MPPVRELVVYIHARDVDTTVEPQNNGHIGDKHFVHCSEVVPSSEVEMYGQYRSRGRTVCPL